MVLRRITLWIIKLIVSVWFREVVTIGQEKIPRRGAVILCGNHSNQFIDPMMIITRTPRHVAFLMA
jgi:glycerol-3-phosphate O-acyltransferase/dihydroxyacetone phosphate acyltransferase